MFIDRPFVEINSRDFLASLQRMIAMTNDHFIMQMDENADQELKSAKDVNYLSKLNLKNIISPML